MNKMSEKVFISQSISAVSNILNKCAKRILMKDIPHLYVGWVYITVENTQKGKLIKHKSWYKVVGNDAYGKLVDNNFNGKVVARFWFNAYDVVKVTGLVADYPYYQVNGKDEYDKLLKRACVSLDELEENFKYEGGYALHIKDLEVFDKPFELSELSALEHGYYTLVHTKL